MILRLLGLFDVLWARLGVNTNHLHAILTTKLKIDDRRPNAFSRMQQKKQKSPKAATLGTMLMSLITGGFYLIAFFITDDYLTSLTIYFSLFIVFLSITLIADFTYVLLDSKDNFIILPKPVNNRTLLVARLLHIMVHVSKIVLPMALPALIFLGIYTGWVSAIAFWFVMTLATLFTLFFINAVYLFILRFTSIERFKDIINGIQVSFSIIIFMTYYFVPRMMDSIQLESTTILSYPYFYVAPSLWFAALWSITLGTFYSGTLIFVLAALGLVAPFLGIWIVIKYLAPKFNSKLAALGRGGAEGKPAQEHRITTTLKKSWGSRISPIIARGNTEKTGFETTWLLTNRNREFKLKVYPGFAYVICYFIFYAIRGTGTLAEKWEALPDSKTYILLIYFTSMAMVSAITNIVYSDKFKAAWVYYASPVKTPGEILSGALKALLVKYFLPFYFAVSIFALYVWGMQIVIDLLLGLINISVFCYLLAFVYLKKMPFSMELNIQRSTGNTMKGIIIMLAPLVIGSLHYFASNFFLLTIVFTFLSSILLWMISSKYRELSWERLDWK